MKKCFPIFILVVIFLTACEPASKPTAYPTYHPDAVEPMSTIFAWQTTCTAAQTTMIPLQCSASGENGKMDIKNKTL
ncbi:MAG: hypothetical protein HN392_13395, partial [Anaerolineae bacterium]|nr:hypothetical protein [Anaerolineae bacterium]